MLLVAALAGCMDGRSRLSVEEAFKCARERFEGHTGTFALKGNTIGYSYESRNGLAKVIVTFDGRHKPVSTFFESAPYGSHEELMDAAQAIKDCAEYGQTSRGASARDERDPPMRPIHGRT
jgi:hypothetical protein